MLKSPCEHLARCRAALGSVSQLCRSVSCFSWDHITLEGAKLERDLVFPIPNHKNCTKMHVRRRFPRGRRLVHPGLLEDVQDPRIALDPHARLHVLRAATCPEVAAADDLRHAMHDDVRKVATWGRPGGDRSSKFSGKGANLSTLPNPWVGGSLD